MNRQNQFTLLWIVVTFHHLGSAFLSSPTKLFGVETPFVCGGSNDKFLSVSSSSSSHRMTSSKEEEGELVTIPTVEQLAKDSFMDQISHASQLVWMLQDYPQEDEDRLSDLLQAQLSHSDGIRGFFATYLTWENEEEGKPQAADSKEIPQPLVLAMKAADPSIIVPLACKNVVMPTAMSTMHQDPQLQSDAALTAQRGIRILSFLAKHNNNNKDEEDSLVSRNCNAIMEATSIDATSSSSSNELVDYWNKFFTNYNYGTQQKQDIMKAIEQVPF